MNNSIKENDQFGCSFVETHFFDYDTSYHHRNVVIFLVAVNGVLATTTTLSNMVVIVSIVKTPASRYPSNILILGLTLSDLGVGVIAQPLFCVLKVLELIHKTDNTIICHVSITFNTIVWLLGAVSFLTLTCITADRFMALHLHLRYQTIISTRRCTFLLIIIWTICIAAVIIKRLLSNYSILQALSIVLCAVGFSANGIFIYKIAKVVERHSAQIQAHDQVPRSEDINMPRYKKSVKTMYYIIGAFMLCYLPVGIAILIHVAVQQRVFTVYWSYFIAGTLAMANSSLNPLIYGWRNKDIRNAVLELFR